MLRSWITVGRSCLEDLTVRMLGLTIGILESIVGTVLGIAISVMEENSKVIHA